MIIANTDWVTIFIGLQYLFHAGDKCIRCVINIKFLVDLSKFGHQYLRTQKRLPIWKRACILHWLHCSWDMVHEGCNYFSFWTIVCPFMPLTAQKIKIKKKTKQRKKHLEISSIIILHMCTKNYDQTMYCYWDMMHDRCNCYFSFWAIFCPFTPQQPKKPKFWKNVKKSWRFHHFTYVYQQLWSDDVQFLRYGAWWM